MRQIFTAYLLNIFFLVNAQQPAPGRPFIAIDHVPIVVKNLDSIKQILSNDFHFKIKEGREHEGIKNCFLKFPDGTYLELISPVDSLQTTGKYYTQFLKRRQGGTSLAVSVTNIKTIATKLQSASLPFEADSNAIWKTVSPTGVDLFFIEYANKAWKDSKFNTTHPNQSLQLKASCIISTNLKAAIDQFKKLGFEQTTNGSYLGIACKQITIGKSKLYLLDAARAIKLTSKFSTQDVNGIAGFEIKVSSLAAMNQLLTKNDRMIIGDSGTIYFLNDYNFFIHFTE